MMIVRGRDRLLCSICMFAECTDLPMGDGVDDADFILYVTAQDQAGCLSSSETVASAGFCLVRSFCVSFLSLDGIVRLR